MKMLISGLILFAITANAQKLPNVQESSLRAPTAIKIDGKANEWNNQFRAYNKTTEIFYTLSNDNDKLYLAVKATDLDIINKIVCGGITLTVNGSGKMKDQGGRSITFPELNIDKTIVHNGPPIGFLGMPQKIDNTAPSRKLIDSFIVFFNKEIILKSKDIRVAGIKEIPDSLISIYNPQGIKAAAQVDKERTFICELVVPLKYLDLSLNVTKPFFYNIKLKGMNPDLTSSLALSVAVNAQRGEILNGTYRIFKPTPTSSAPTFPPPVIQGQGNTDIIASFAVKDGVYSIGGAKGARTLNLITPTSFWGEYILIK